jgi:ABC-type nitrate/sulfonate/bicarbonate transport system substrate-binding protein
MRRSLTLAVVTAALLGAGILEASAQTKITVGKTTGGSGFHLPSYVAMTKGMFKAEGLDATFITMTGKALVTAGLSGNVNFVPIPGGGSQASLQGAPLRYIVGQSLMSQWAIVTPQSIAKVEDLKGKTLGYGRAGSADYDEGEIVLSRFFNMKIGRDYKVISFQGEPERLAALTNGDIQGALVSVPHVAKAKLAGFKALLNTGTYLPRVGGTFWTMQAYLDKNPDTVKRFIRAIARACEYINSNKDGTVDVIQEEYGVKDRKEAEAIWAELQNAYGAEIPTPLFVELFEGRRQEMISEGTWPKDKPLPDVDKYVTRDLLNATLTEIGYKPRSEGQIKSN